MTGILASRPIVFAASLLIASCGAPKPPSPQMSFFVTSTGLSDGGNLGGIPGADGHCQRLAAAVGSSRTWRAYLSAPGTPAVNAGERIGHGPWFNAAGIQIAANLAELHGDGAAMTRETLLTEHGSKVPSATHDMLTGSTEDGRLVPSGTCQGWTSNGAGAARVGHSDRVMSIEESRSWSSAHSTGCSAKAMRAELGAGLFYCFAID
jgi:hypothetical protein